MKKPSPSSAAKAKVAKAKSPAKPKMAKGAKGAASAWGTTRSAKKATATSSAAPKPLGAPKSKAAPKPKAAPAPAPKPVRKSRPASPLVAALVAAFADKKVEDVRVLDVSELSTITDFLVIGTGNSETHLRALRIEADRVLKEFGTHIIGRDTQLESGWTVVDAFDVMVHLLTAEKREYYRLEHLWRDADEIPIAEILGK
jgi:ribosome-associated protein